MSAFIKTVLIGSLTGLFIVIGCGNPASSQPTDPAVGTWKGIVSDSAMTMIVRSDSTFTTVLPNKYGTYYLSGTYTSKGDTISLAYASGLQGEEGIPPPSTPVSGTISGNKMTIPIPYNQNGDSTTLKKQ